MKLIIWPALVTLAITLLRLAGERLEWSTTLFNPAAGGGGSPIGISWLPPFLGAYFAWKLAKGGEGPASPGKVIGVSLAGIAGIIALAVAASVLGPLGPLVGGAVASIIAPVFVVRTWKALGMTLFSYALAARIPVAIIMLIAISGQWGTHYDVLPPDAGPELTAMGTLGRWFWIGLVPQMTFWVAFTILVGMLFGALTVLIAKPQPSNPAAP
jgi:hypothetical protein